MTAATSYDLSWLRRSRSVRRGRVYPWSYKSGMGMMALDSAPSPIEKDESRMYAGCILATTSRDREGDILEVSGIDTTGHQRLPVAMVDHGMFYPLPIGECRTPEGAYTVTIDAAAGVCRQGTYFRQNDEVAFQLYDMAIRGVLGNSIGYRELEVQPLRPDPGQGHFRRKDGTGGKHLLRIEMTEATWTAVPTNPECVREEWSRDLIGGKRLAPCVKAMLRPWLPPRRAFLFTGEGKAFNEDQPRDDHGRWGEGGGGGSKDSASKESSPVERGQKLLEEHAIKGGDPKELCGKLAEMKGKDLAELAKSHGVKAGGKKAELAERIAKEVGAKLAKDPVIQQWKETERIKREDAADAEIRKRRDEANRKPTAAELERPSTGYAPKPRGWLTGFLSDLFGSIVGFVTGGKSQIRNESSALVDAIVDAVDPDDPEWAEKAACLVSILSAQSGGGSSGKRGKAMSEDKDRKPKNDRDRRPEGDEEESPHADEPYSAQQHRAALADLKAIHEEHSKALKANENKSSHKAMCKALNMVRGAMEVIHGAHKKAHSSLGLKDELPGELDHKALYGGGEKDDEEDEEDDEEESVAKGKSEDEDDLDEESVGKCLAIFRDLHSGVAALGKRVNQATGVA